MKRILCLVMLFAVIGSTTFLNAQIPRLVYKVIPLIYGFSDNRCLLIRLYSKY